MTVVSRYRTISLTHYLASRYLRIIGLSRYLPGDLGGHKGRLYAGYRPRATGHDGLVEAALVDAQAQAPSLTPQASSPTS
jgi:hypothetical protein